MNGKPRDMDYQFAIKVLSGAKVDLPSMHGNPKRYGYQNQTFYDIARNMAIRALKENEQLKAELEEVKQRADEWHRKAELTAEKLDGAINAQETLQKVLAEKTAEIERLIDNLNNKCAYLSDDETTEYCVDGPCPKFKTEAQIRTEAIKEFAERLRTQSVDAMGFVIPEDVVCVDDIDNLVKEMAEPSLLDKKFGGDTE